MSSGIPEPLFTPLVLRDAHHALDRAATGGRVLLMCSPAGSGKTVCAADWLRRRLDRTPDLRHCWISITESIDDATRLWSTLRDGLGRPPVAGHESVDPLARADELIGELAGTPAVIVLDDAHLLTDPLALAALEHFLAQCPDEVLTIVTGRFEPPLRWHLLEMAGRLARIGATELAFDDNQIRTVFVEHGCPLDDTEAAAILELTCGWAALVRIAALYTAMHGAERGAALGMLAHAPHPISDFLVGELIDVLEVPVREFLLATSVPDGFTEEFAEELAGPRASRVLDDLARINFPIQHTAHRDRIWYSYHPMLRAYLLAELQRATPQRLGDLHRRSARWLLDAGDPLAAMGHVLAEPHRPHLRSFLTDHGLRLVLEGSGPLLFQRLDHACASLLDDPFVLLLRVVDAVERGDEAAAVAYLEQVQARELTVSALVTESWLSALHLAAACAVAVAAGIHAAFPDGGRELPEDDPAATGNVELDCYLAVQLGSVRICAGRAEASEQLLHRGLRLAEQQDDALLRQRAVTRLAAAALFTGPVPLLRERAARAVELGAACAVDLGAGGSTDHLHALALRALGAHLQGEAVSPDDPALLAQTRRGLDGTNEPIAGRHAHIVGLLLEFETATDRHATASALHTRMRRLLTDSARPPHPLPTARLLLPVVSVLLRLHEREAAQRLATTGMRVLHGVPDAVLAAAAVAESTGRPFETLDLVAPLVQRARTERALPTASAVTAWLLYACASHRLDRPVKSYEGFAEAVRLAAPEHLVRPFTDVPGALALLREHAGRFGPDDAFVDLVRGSTDAAAGTGTPALTEAELTVLKQLPSGRTAAQIAHDLGVSVNTVKTHLRAVYAKLGTNSRADAMSQARRIGLL